MFGTVIGFSSAMRPIIRPNRMMVCKQCEERNWPEITDTDADEDEIALTNNDQQSMGNSIYENVSLMIMNFIKCA
ncbi:hypothetical protein DPMN_027685 [Dreissena polymorpha]|uniref:Uncharacterized protein n=1 Tax=Dreissena polymorpha TaxID=45954 RepID=A0A9D4RFG8_DREPO|nr:hypothetical protein DPMN_027685 [Dreissena polymorpha]